MNIKDDLKIKGNLIITKWNSDGVKIDERRIPNLIVTSGKVFIASRMVGTTSSIMSHMAIGASSVAPVASNTALGVELGRVALASGTFSGNTITYTATFPAGTGTGTLTEAGIFNASSAGTMLCRTTFAPFTKLAGETISVSWNITLS